MSEHESGHFRSPGGKGSFAFFVGVDEHRTGIHQERDLTPERTS